MTLNENIKYYRKKMNLTQEQLAEIMGVSVGAVSKWESGLANPDIMLLPKLAKLFGVSVDVLFSYELMDDSAIELSKKIREYYFEKQYDKGAELALDAIRRYPNHFDIIYQSASLFRMQGIERKNKEALEKALELYKRSCILIGQKRDESISELSIQVTIGEILISLDRTEEAYEHLKKYNYCGINNSLIGSMLANGENPKEALPYLSDSFLNNIVQLFRCCVSFANVYCKQNDYKMAYDVINMMYEFFKHLKKDGQVSYIDKLQVISLAIMAGIHAEIRQFKEAEKCLEKAYELAVMFDASPDYNVQNIKFYNGQKLIFSDDSGVTAMESVESIISPQDVNSDFLKKIWSNIMAKNKQISKGESV